MTTVDAVQAIRRLWGSMAGAVQWWASMLFSW